MRTGFAALGFQGVAGVASLGRLIFCVAQAQFMGSMKHLQNIILCIASST
jgi:hypothetical protein